MRYAAILVLAAAALAGEKEALEEFSKARAESPLGVDPQEIRRAVDALAEIGGPVSVDAIATFVHESFVEGRRILARIEKVKLEGQKAFKAIDRLGRELEHLRHRQGSGATGLGPEIEARETELQRARAGFEKAKAETGASDKRYLRLQESREACAVACTKIVARLPADRIAEAIRALRAALEVTDEQESLMLVRILRQSKRPECAPALLEIYSQPSAPGPTRIEAACAVALIGDRASLRTMLGRFDASDEAATRRFLHAVSRVARRKLDSIEQAKKWAESDPAEAGEAKPEKGK